MAAVLWNSAFEGTPAGSDDPSAGDDRIRELKETTRTIVGREHQLVPATDSALGDQGWHLAGSAVAYYQAAEPTNRPDGSTSLDTDDDGRLWVDSDDGKLYVYTGSAWDAITAGTTVTDALTLLTAAEIQQIQNIGTETISATNWGHLAATDQDVASTDDVDFASVDIGGGYGSTGTTLAANGDISTDGDIQVDGTSTIGNKHVFSDDITVSAYTASYEINDTGLIIGHDSSLRTIELQTYSTTRLSIAGNGTVTIPGSTYIGGGYGSTGTTIASDGDISTDGDLAVDGSVTASSGISTGDATLKCKVLDIGDWNMGTVGFVTVAHGVTWSNIRSVSVLIRNDAGSTNYSLDYGGYWYVDATNVTLQRDTGGAFESIYFNSTSYNRGWITIWYEA